MKRESEKEWYFGNADKERSGPYGFHEVCVLEELFVMVLVFLVPCCLANLGVLKIVKLWFELLSLAPTALPFIFHMKD